MNDPQKKRGERRFLTMAQVITLVVEKKSNGKVSLKQTNKGTGRFTVSARSPLITDLKLAEGDKVSISLKKVTPNVKKDIKLKKRK